jgi:tRNA modification GTPase
MAAGLDTDTIVAVATAPGLGGVGIVRVSGPAAHRIGTSVAGSLPAARTAGFRSFLDGEGRPLDSGLVLAFNAPASFTGENVVEFQGHGGPVVLGMLVDELVRLGARPARPGEFTERAYLNGKLDLAQAEAVADLIAGASEEAVRGANRSLSGEFSRHVHTIDDAVTDLRVFIEAAMDFPDEDIDLLAEGQIAERLEEILDQLRRLRVRCAEGVVLRDGIRLALVGAPNVGKSSLLNRLAGESRAIVTDLPGTTRDLIRADLVIDGLPVEVVDTAGLREAEDLVEREGVRRALDAARDADIVLLVSAAEPTERSDEAFPVKGQIPQEWVGEWPEEKLVRVLNKSDLLEYAGQGGGGVICVSALTGDGMDRLIGEIRDRAGLKGGTPLFTARKRHLVALDQALEATERSIELAGERVPGEIVAEELRLVHGALGEIVGETTTDALLGEIFSRFCIGK